MNNYQAQIIQLKDQKEQMRLFLHELIEAFYKSVNGNQKTSFGEEQKNSAESQKDNSSNWTLSPDLENLLKGLSEIVKSCPNCSRKTDFKFSTNLNECNWEQMKDIFSKMPGGKNE